MAKKTFENALEELEKTARDLETGDLSLEISLKKFEEGIKLAEFCNRKLDDAQKKVDILLKKDNRLKSVPFDPATGESTGGSEDEE
ncbi:MAG: exodeoxyribonuclease VII small subunit [Desulfobulbaceae bacterium]|nr:exodeoxyribonuclease VII small subunit [Desulfobulbaceae bacterium]